MSDRSIDRGGGEVHVDRLRLRVAGLDEGAAEVLARLVAEGLVPVLGRASAGVGLDHLRVEVHASEGGARHKGVATTAEAPDQLAARIVERVGRVLAGDRAVGTLGEGPLS
jgi:hypothetical protein